MDRNKIKHVFTALKGMAMGAADVVPGVSGGTIAFITGIYDTLLNSIASINLPNLKLLLQGKFVDFWKAVNGNFLLSLFIGIGISFVSLAKLTTYLIEFHPVLIWAFFFGLVAASILYVGRQVEKWNTQGIVAFILGTGIAFWTTILPPVSSPDASWYLFLCGAIAICAMILPGISGSFILLLLGAYQSVWGGLHRMEFDVIIPFALGCVTGLMLFSRFLKWTFSRFKNTTIALLTGFLLGSLNKLWPWKKTISTRVHHPGEADEKIIPFLQENCSPSAYTQPNDVELNELLLTEFDPQLWQAIGLAVVGFGLIFILEFIGKRAAKA